MFYDQLTRIKQGSKILEAWGLTAPLSLGGVWIKMADVNLKTDLYKSFFGDTRLHFQHKRMKLDTAFWPSAWVKLAEDVKFNDQDPTQLWGYTVPTGPGVGWPVDDEGAKQKFMQQVATYGCPFAWLLGMN
jgi:hypothetical protein